MEAKPLTLKNVTLIYKNFAGEAGRFNEKGKRSFSVFIGDEEVAQELIAQGWRLKKMKCLDDVCLFDTFHLPVKVNFDSRYPPRIHLVKSAGVIPYDESMVHELDAIPLSSVDLVVVPYKWEGDTNPGHKAYLQVLYATMDENELDLMYADLPMATR